MNIAAGPDLGLFEANEAAEIIHSVAHPDANIIFGTVIDENMGDEVRVTVIAAGFDRWEDRSGASSAPASLGLLSEPEPVDIFADVTDSPKTSFSVGGDDDFDVPSFLQ